MGELSGLQIRTVEPQPEEPQQLYVKVPVQLELSGHFHQFAKFFFNISQRDRAINMENISLTRAGGAAGGQARQASGGNGQEIVENVDLQVTVLATTFHRPAAARPGAAGATAPAQGGHR